MGVGGWGDNNQIFANYNCVNMADGGIPKPTFHIFVKICKFFFLTCSLSSSIISVSIISEARDDVLVLIEMRVDSSCEDADLRIVLIHGPQTLGTTHEVEEQNVLGLDTMILQTMR